LRKTRIYYPKSINLGETLTLSATASHHLIRVLRYKANTAVTVFNGKGGEFSAVLLDNNPKAAQLQILDCANTDRESPLRIKLLQGISRNEHMDTTIQKTTELGVVDIVPVICERSASIKPNRIDKKLERWNQIAISACEQCGRNKLPKVHRATPFDQAICDDSSACKLALDPTATEGIMTQKHCADTVSIFCGPEGGLSDREISAACDAGYRNINFGPRILRTETAGAALVAALQVIWGDMG
jgi:16S rRNA (uracil1498-N3)-methyltransferase